MMLISKSWTAFCRPMVFLAALIAVVSALACPIFAGQQKDMEVAISIGVSWSDLYNGAGALETGRYTIEVHGKVAPLQADEGDEEALLFFPSGMTATYHYENKAYRMNSGKCPKLDYEESGSGTIPVVSAMGTGAAGPPG